MAGCRLWENFRKRFRISSPAFSLGEPVADPALISDSERLSRYVTDQKHFSVEKDQVGFRAFLPSPQSDELSITRTQGLAEPDVWTFGASTVAAPSGRAIFARGDFLAPHVRESFVEPWRLSVSPAEPPVRHALILGWPPVGESEIRKTLAQQLRARAKLQVRPVSAS